MKRKSVYLTDKELSEVFYSETLNYFESEDGDSEEYKEAMTKLYREMNNRGLIPRLKEQK